MWTRLEKKDTTRFMKYLVDNTPNTNSIISNIQKVGVSYNPFAFRSGYYYVHWGSGIIDGFVVNYNDGNIFTHLSNESAIHGATRILSNTRYHSVWGLSDWLPSTNIIEAAIRCRVDSRDLITMIRDTSQPLPEYSHRVIRIDKKMSIGKYMPFIKTCLYEGFGFRPMSMDIKKRMKERSDSEPYFLLYDDGKPVSQAHIQAMTQQYGYIAGICTPRIYRRNGYAKEITSYACKYIESQGIVSALTVNIDNHTAIDMYANMGFSPTDGIKVYMRHRAFCGDENQ